MRTVDVLALELPDPLLAAVQDAAAAAGQLHQLPDLAPRIPVRADETLMTEARYDKGAIVLHPARPNRRVAFLHEFGHYLDDLVIGPPDRIASSSDLLAPWRAAVVRSRPVALTW